MQQGSVRNALKQATKPGHAVDTHSAGGGRIGGPCWLPPSGHASWPSLPCTKQAGKS